jgi:hypothetical protein
MTETKPIIDLNGYMESIKTLDESNKCTINSLNQIYDSCGGYPSPRKLALAICNIQSSIEIFKRTEKELMDCLLQQVKSGE